MSSLPEFRRSQGRGDERWWRHRRVAVTIGFHAVALSAAILGVLLSIRIASGFLATQGGGLSRLLWIVETSLMECTVYALIFGCGFGLPAGVIYVLSCRDRALELEQRVNLQVESHDDPR